MPTSCHIPKRVPSVVEILGPAGSGKTTLLRVLTERWQRIVPNVDVGRSYCLPFLIRNVTVRWPGFLRQYRRDRWFTWSETRSMVYVEAWHRHLGRRHLGDGRVTVFDQGPLFRLARLRAFGPALTRSAVYTRWQDEMLRRWTSTLDVAVYLDAPNNVLCERIDARDSRHRIKRHSASEVDDFLRRYRTSFEEVLRRFADTGRLKVLRFNTARESTAQLADRILASLGFDTEEG
ncbi:MAG: AAA family ATPase [Thermoguttaceae bacterium]